MRRSRRLKEPPDLANLELDREQEEPESGSRLRFALKVAGAALVVACVAALLILRTWPPINVVLSNSMEPTIKTGDVVVMQKLDDPPKVGDIVAIRPTAEQRKKFGFPDVVIHRIVKIVGGTATTKGDNRKQPDPFTTPLSQLKSKVVWTIPAAGRVINFFTSPLGLLWIGIGVVLLIVLPYFESQKEAAERDVLAMESLERMSEEIDSMGEELRLLGEVRPRAPPAPSEEPPPEAPDDGALGRLDADVREVHETMSQVVGAVGEYGEHLRSHTEILQAMSAASLDLAETVASLRDLLERHGGAPEPPLAATQPKELEARERELPARPVVDLLAMADAVERTVRDTDLLREPGPAGETD